MEKKKKTTSTKTGKTAIWLKTIGVSGIVEFFATMCGISLGCREFVFFASGVYNGTTEIFPLCNGDLNMVLYF